jgi:hypothetical protein
MGLMWKESYLIWTKVQDAGLTAQAGTYSTARKARAFRAVFLARTKPVIRERASWALAFSS